MEVSMKLTSLILALSLVLSSVALAETRPLSGFFEVQTTTPNPKLNLILDAGLTYRVGPQWGAKAFFLMKGPWAQAYVGPVWQPLPWLNLSVCAGASQLKGLLELRTAYSLGLTYRQFAFNGAVEMNNAAYQGDYKSLWYDLTVAYQPLSWLIVGLKDRRPVGFGPMVRFKYDVAEVWVNWAPVSSENSTTDLARFLLGLKFNL